MEPKANKVINYAKVETFVRLELSRINNVISMLDESQKQQDENDKQYEPYALLDVGRCTASDLEEALFYTADSWTRLRASAHHCKMNLESMLYQLELKTRGKKAAKAKKKVNRRGR